MNIAKFVSRLIDEDVQASAVRLEEAEGHAVGLRRTKSLIIAIYGFRITWLKLICFVAFPPISIALLMPKPPSEVQEILFITFSCLWFIGFLGLYLYRFAAFRKERRILRNDKLTADKSRG